MTVRENFYIFKTLNGTNRVLETFIGAISVYTSQLMHVTPGLVDDRCYGLTCEEIIDRNF